MYKFHRILKYKYKLRTSGMNFFVLCIYNRQGISTNGSGQKGTTILTVGKEGLSCCFISTTASDA
jgi:hypothetical protein